MKNSLVSLFGVILLNAAFPAFSVAQGQMLTKGETISYINKIAGRAVGYSCVWIGCSKRYGHINYASFEESGDNVVYRMKTDAFDDGYCRADAYDRRYEFNPAHIKKIEMSKMDGTAIAVIKIYLSDYKLIKVTHRGKESVADYIGLYFQYADQKNFESLKKAFLHLKDLVQAEEDPFGE